MTELRLRRMFCYGVALGIMNGQAPASVLQVTDDKDWMDATPSRMTLGSNKAQFLQLQVSCACTAAPPDKCNTGNSRNSAPAGAADRAKASRLWTSARVKGTMSSADYRTRVLNTDQVRMRERTQCVSCLSHGHARSEQLWTRDRKSVV